jgi:hypothetical protein
MWNAPLMKELGVVAASSLDWTLGEIIPVFSCTAMVFGATTFFLGPWAERAGPAITALAAAGCYSTACVISGIGAMTHQLPLLVLTLVCFCQQTCFFCLHELVAAHRLLFLSLSE